MVLDGEQFALGICGHANVLITLGTIADVDEHLLPCNRVLHRLPTQQFGRHGGKKNVRMRQRFAAKRTTHIGRKNRNLRRQQSQQQTKQNRYRQHALISVVQRQALVGRRQRERVIPDRDDRVRFQRIVMLGGRGVGLIELESDLC